MRIGIVGASGRVDQRIIVDRRQRGQVRIRAAQQRSQVVILAKKCVKASIHRRRRTIAQGVGPSPHPSAQVVARLDDIDADAAFAEPGRRGKTGDPGADNDDPGRPLE